MSRPQPRELTVIKKEHVTPNMLRVTLGGKNIHTIPKDQESGYVKLIFPTETGRLMRTYTIRHQRDHEIDLDFMLHLDAGPACQWAKTTQPNDVILVGGPGPKKMVTEKADWCLLVGDMTALPAISVNLEKLPSDAKGYAIIEVVSEADIQVLTHPADVKLHWVVNPRPGEDDRLLLNKLKTLTWLDSDVYVWCACEFSSMKVLRHFFKGEKNISKQNLYISSYWKLGSSEDQHKEVKRMDAETSGI